MATPKRRTASFLAALAVAGLALAPALAEARAGGGFSSGSRGSRSYSAPPSTQTAPNTSRSMDRTMTEPSRPAQPGYAQPTAPRTAGGGFFSRSPFMAGLMGGLIGAGIGGLLFGHGLFGGISGFAGFLGFLLQIALIAGIVWLVLRLIRGTNGRGAPAYAGAGAGAGTGYARDMQGNGHHGARPMGSFGGRAAAPATTPIQLQPQDFQTFERMLGEVNAAWSRQDMDTLRRLSTAEMAGYFAQDLKDLAARGWTNTTSDVRLEQGDLSEAWREPDGEEYATVAMRFSLVDVTTRLADGGVVEGHPTDRTEAVELWTFVRGSSGDWKLSAIQQAGR